MADDAYRRKQQIFGGVNQTYIMATTDTTKNIVAPPVASVSKIAVQRIKVTVTTGAAGKTLALGSSSGDVTLTEALDMSTAGAEYERDFGPKGVPFLTAGDSVKATISAAGAGAIISIEGYRLAGA